MSSTEIATPVPKREILPSQEVSWFRAFMRKLRWVLHPVTIFVGLQVLWVVLIVFWVNWFYEGQNQLAELMKSIGNQVPDTPYQLASLTAGIVLLVLILIGVVFLFVAAVRQASVNRQQRSFVSSVTHELRSPLASLKLFIETLRTRNVDPPTKDQILAMMDTDTERLSRLVDQILVSGRLDRGAMSFGTPEKVDVAALIQTVVTSLKYADPGITERVRVEISGPVFMLIPRPALSLIFSNLLENAIKYSPKGTPILVKISIGRGEFQMQVIDKGLGLERSERRRIFKMFHRADGAIKKAIPGTGLGLYIVRETARVLGGRVSAESEGLGAGAAFTLSIPLVESGA